MINIAVFRIELEYKKVLPFKVGEVRIVIKGHHSGPLRTIGDILFRFYDKTTIILLYTEAGFTWPVPER